MGKIGKKILFSFQQKSYYCLIFDIERERERERDTYYTYPLIIGNNDDLLLLLLRVVVYWKLIVGLIHPDWFEIGIFIILWNFKEYSIIMIYYVFVTRIYWLWQPEQKNGGKNILHSNHLMWMSDNSRHTRQRHEPFLIEIDRIFIFRFN